MPTVISASGARAPALRTGQAIESCRPPIKAGNKIRKETQMQYLAASALLASISLIMPDDNQTSGFANNAGHHDIAALTIAQMPAQLTERGCCFTRNGTNGWDWSDDVTREQCLKDNRAAGGSVSDAYHYPRETCQGVQSRCGSPNPC